MRPREEWRAVKYERAGDIDPVAFSVGFLESDETGGIPETE